MKAEQSVRTPAMRGEIPESIWAGIEAEFTVPSLDAVRGRLETEAAIPDQVMRQLVRVFIDGCTFCPGFQFLPGGVLEPRVVYLFGRAMDLKIPHNYFAAWMVTPSTDLDGARPVEMLTSPERLADALEVFARR